MDALVPVFIAVLLAEVGGPMQALAHALGRSGKGTIFALSLIGLTGAILFAASAIAGVLMEGLMPPLGRDLFFALSLIFAGVPMLWMGSVKPAVQAITTLAAAPQIALQMATGAAPFIVLAASAKTGNPALAASAALVAVLMQAHLPLVFRDDWPGHFPIRWVRLGAGLLITLAGVRAAIAALQIG